MYMTGRMAVRQMDDHMPTTQPPTLVADTSVPPPPLLTTGVYDNHLFSGTSTETIWNVNRPNILSNNIRGESRDLTGAPNIGPLPTRQHQDEGMSFPEIALGLGSVIFSLRQLNAVLTEIYEYSVYMSDQRLVELGIRPEGLARQIWHLTSAGLETIWFPLRLRAENLRDRVVFGAIDEQNTREELLKFMRCVREEHDMSSQSAAAGTPTGASGCVFTEFCLLKFSENVGLRHEQS